mmetsp:Transcript_3283/g.9510  ORF Transcript_3283/g.9510 Transcript_3283/m.9510 type:complete len:550 (-) Transcript_3283:20-1669(-)|eukprot:CAMPEP_0206135930 /NCGR_PEP_ID=MMETSP1473-20131121/1181_1 /ASSEMBLY_ACC=CAM_ASM_001109 /TAXON_ID=1461547 /ORGANISM="Stichococcus sp, Strain RCC1054" /LENGTH=549 /DNA_ID=CAMNT_0053528099 /DNA_START=168 /DNA_END=1817 /DNA_ORIENTATION=-
MQLQGLNIWSTGPILEAVQNNNFFSDSKHFVDKPLTVSPSQAEADFKKLPKLKKNGTAYRNSTLLPFLQKDFSAPGSELKASQAKDFVATPNNFLPEVNNASIRQWALDVHGLWNQLYRVEDESVAKNPERHSLLPIPNGVVVPGARFRELYYWDSYWILKGLLVSNMKETATGMVENLLSLLKSVGHIPNGSRTYYLNRSQPPLMSAMVRDVYAATNDTALLNTALPLLVKEHAYWMTSPKLVKVASGDTTYSLSRYHAVWNLPRPESFREDEETASNLTGAAKAQLYTELASGAESGWDYSSRWFSSPEDLSTIRTTKVVPVDLNAYLYDMEINIAKFAKVLKDTSTSTKFSEAAKTRAAGIQALMWDSKTGQWRDLIINSTNPSDVSTVSQSAANTAANYIPLWAGLADPGSSRAQAALKAFKGSKLLGVAGISTTTVNSGQQWDYPNAWPPLQDLLIEGFANTGGSEGKQLAQSIAQRWLLTMFTSWSSKGKFNKKMVEKYDATAIGVSGGGGEYAVQAGFGWTNGVMLSLLDQYGWNAGKERLG